MPNTLVWGLAYRYTLNVSALAENRDTFTSLVHCRSTPYLIIVPPYLKTLPKYLNTLWSRQNRAWKASQNGVLRHPSALFSAQVGYF